MKLLNVLEVYQIAQSGLLEVNSVDIYFIRSTTSFCGKYVPHAIFYNDVCLYFLCYPCQSKDFLNPDSHI